MTVPPRPVVPAISPRRPFPSTRTVPVRFSRASGCPASSGAGPSEACCGMISAHQSISPVSSRRTRTSALISPSGPKARSKPRGPSGRVPSPSPPGTAASSGSWMGTFRAAMVTPTVVARSWPGGESIGTLTTTVVSAWPPARVVALAPLASMRTVRGRPLASVSSSEGRSTVSSTSSAMIGTGKASGSRPKFLVRTSTWTVVLPSTPGWRVTSTRASASPPIAKAGVRPDCPGLRMSPLRYGRGQRVLVQDDLADFRGDLVERLPERVVVGHTEGLDVDVDTRGDLVERDDGGREHFRARRCRAAQADQADLAVVEFDRPVHAADRIWEVLEPHARVADRGTAFDALPDAITPRPPAPRAR